MTRKPQSADALNSSGVLVTGAQLRAVQAGDRPDPGDVGARRVDLVAVNAAIHDLTAHHDPTVVFGHLAQLLVPVVCDEVTPVVQSAELDESSCRTDRTSTRRGRAGDTEGDPARFTVKVHFNSGSAPLTCAADPRRPADYQVAFTCTWWVHRPTAPEVALIELLGRLAVGAVNQARQAAALREADHQIQNLQVALNSNRAIGAAIGVLMTRHMLTYEQAFALLVSTSQRANRKLSALADEVVLTGEIPP